MDNKHIFFVFLVVVIYMVHRQIKYSDSVKEDTVVNSLETVKKNDSQRKKVMQLLSKIHLKMERTLCFPLLQL